MTTNTDIETSKQDMFQILDDRDRQQIINPADFREDSSLVYNVHGHLEPSYLGIKSIVFLMAQNNHPLQTMPNHCKSELLGENKEKTWYATVYVQDATTQQLEKGEAQERYYKYHTDKQTGEKIFETDSQGNLVPDDFGKRVAESKAERNAKRKLIPEFYITKMINDAQKKGQTTKVDAGAKQKQQQQQKQSSEPQWHFDKPCTCNKPTVIKVVEGHNMCGTCGGNKNVSKEGTV